MSDLEDDVLMQMLALSRQMETSKLRMSLLNLVWRDLDQLLKGVLREPALARELELELDQLKKSVVAVLEFDAKHKDGA
jgi:hypothetical protein